MESEDIKLGRYIYIEGKELLEDGRLLEKKNNKFFIVARNRFKEASELGYHDATTALGLMYIFGDEISQDIETGFKYLSKAENNKNTDALFWLGYIYFNGVKRSIKPNKEKAKYYLKKDQVFNRFKNADYYKEMLSSLENWLTKSDELGNFSKLSLWFQDNEQIASHQQI